MTLAHRWTHVQSRAWPWWSLLIVVVIGHALDLATTLLAFQAGAHEANPLMAHLLLVWGVAGVIALKIAGALILAALLAYCGRTPAARQGAYATLGLLATCVGAALIWSAVLNNVANVVILHSPH